MKRFVLLAVSLGLAACASMSGVPDRSVDVKSELDSLKKYFLPSVFSTYDSKPSDLEKKLYRNEVLSARIRAIDLNFNEFIKNISVENKKLNIGTDTTVLLLGAAGAVSTVSSTQAILSATSATVTGVKTSIDKNAYYDTTLAALVSQMRASRQQILLNIYYGMDMDVEDYPLMRALVDVENYFQAGTIIGAVTEINKEAGKQKAKADQEIQSLVKDKFKKDKAGDILRSYWKPDGKTISKNNESQIKAWMKKNNIGDISITMFMFGQQYSALREKAINDLNLVEK